MQAKMEKEMRVLIGMCDHMGRMSIPSIFSLFMDLATEHGSDIRLGIDDLAEKGLFWLTVKTKVRIMERPEMMSDIMAETWPETPGRASCNRYYALRKEGRTIVEGKSEWAIIEKDSGKLRKLAEVYPGDIEHCPDTVCDGPYMRLSKDFSGCEEIGRYTVRSTDIDIGQHMNNAAYVHAMFGAFSCRELDTMNVQEAEVHFRAPCFEGDRLSVFRRDTDGGVELGILRSDGTTAVCARFLCG